MTCCARRLSKHGNKIHPCLTLLPVGIPSHFPYSVLTEYSSCPEYRLKSIQSFVAAYQFILNNPQYAVLFGISFFGIKICIEHPICVSSFCVSYLLAYSHQDFDGFYLCSLKQFYQFPIYPNGLLLLVALRTAFTSLSKIIFSKITHF